jgi:hypothetical protein
MGGRSQYPPEMNPSLAAACALLAVSIPEELNKGDKVPAKKFQEVIWNFDGAEGLAEYLGEPVLVDFWGKN